MTTNGVIAQAQVKALFNKQWVNGDLATFMKNVKARTKEVYGIDLEFSNKQEFIDQLVEHELIKTYPKVHNRTEREMPF